jgi:hypothetical protein
MKKSKRNEWVLVENHAQKKKEKKREKKRREFFENLDQFLQEEDLKHILRFCPNFQPDHYWRNHIELGFPFCNSKEAKSRLMEKMDKNEDTFTVPGKKYHIYGYLEDGYCMGDDVVITFEKRDFNGGFQDGNRVFIFYNPQNPIFDRSILREDPDYEKYICPTWCPFYRNFRMKLLKEYRIKDEDFQIPSFFDDYEIHRIQSNLSEKIYEVLYKDDIRIMLQHSSHDDGWLNSAMGVIINLKDL